MKQQLTALVLFLAALPLSDTFAQRRVGEEENQEKYTRSIEYNQPPMLPPSPPPPTDPEELVYLKVDESPLFPGCNSQQMEAAELRLCSDKNLMEFIDNNLKYPNRAKKKGIEGTVVVSFIIEKDGSISQPTVRHDLKAGCGQEAFRIVESMPQWIPGKLNGKPVRVQYNLPIKFKLNQADES